MDPWTSSPPTSTISRPDSVREPVEFSDAVAGLLRGDFDALAPLFFPDPAGRPPEIVRWHDAALFRDHPAALAEALTCASFLGATEVARHLLEHGVDPLAGAGTGMDALHWAVNRGKPETVALLLERGLPLEARNTHGSTVLGTAVWSAIHEPRPAHLAIIDALLNAGADPQGADYPTGDAAIDALLQGRGRGP
jgi:hypothetical protein